MKEFKFEYEEYARGTIIIEAETEEEARDLIYSGDGDTSVYKSEMYLGKLVE